MPRIKEQLGVHVANSGPVDTLSYRLGIKSVAQSSALVITGILVVRGANVLMRIVLGRTLGPHDLGIISTVWSMATMLGVLAIVGVTPTVTRFLALYRKHRDEASARALVTESVIWILLLSTGFGGLVTAFAPAIAARWLGDAALEPLVRLGAMSIPAWAFLLWLVAVFRGMSETAPAIFARDLSRAVLALGMLAILWWRTALSVESAVRYLYVLPTWIACAIGAWLLWPRIKDVLFVHGYHSEKRTWFRFGWPLGLSMFLQNTTGRSIDILLLGYLASPADVGIYVSALSLVGLLGLALQGVNYLALPSFTTSTEQAKSRRLQQIRLLTFELTWPVTLTLILWPELVMQLTFGKAFSVAAITIPILALGYAVSNFFGPVGQMLLAEGRTRWQLLADIISITSFLAAAFGLVPILGILGMAVARSLSQITFNIVASVPLWGKVWNMPSLRLLNVAQTVAILGGTKLASMLLLPHLSEITSLSIILIGIAFCYLQIFRHYEHEGNATTKRKSNA